MTPKALVYSTDSFSHKTIVIFEVQGVDRSVYYIRTLQSEGKLIYETTIPDPETGRRTIRIKKEGPTNFIVTTTSQKFTLRMKPETGPSL